MKETTGGDAAVATNLAYPVGDKLLLGIVIGAMTAGRGRLDRTWLCFGAGVGVFAVADSSYLFEVAEGPTRPTACSTSAGRSARC